MVKLLKATLKVKKQLIIFLFNWFFIKKGKVARTVVVILDYNQYLAMLIGIGLTISVQSSSIVTRWFMFCTHP